MIELELLRSGRAYYGVKELGNAVRAKEEREREAKVLFFGKIRKFGDFLAIQTRGCGPGRFAKGREGGQVDGRRSV